MIRELFKKAISVLKSASAANGTSKTPEPAGILRSDYYELSRLVQQIEYHAERAPYPHVTQRLTQIAVEKKVHLQLLREKLLSLGVDLSELPLDLRSGKNHWERMVQDLEDEKALETRFTEQAVLSADDAPEISDFLQKIVAAQLPHKEILLDLVARADPQADLS